MTEPSSAEAAVPPPLASPERIPTPWPEFTSVLDLVFRHKAGVIAEEGSAEATIGQDIALHVAAREINTLLFTTAPPTAQPGALALEIKAHPTPDYINNRVRHPARGRHPELVVIEHYERLRAEPRYIPNQYDPIDDLDYEPPTAADELLQCVRDIHIDIPLLLTTTVSGQPQLPRPLDHWLDTSHPAVTLTEVCKPVILLRRTTGQTVEARLEINPSGPSGHRVPMAWPAKRQ
ncbi:hypothetical protein ABZ791_36235 [Streptomyces huasconensis]|uniref:Uncharacterized protein n=1 Tax=Streptomyces huasconensis TaxID=1854574 RepID=A0ABV3M5Y6_9ACTN